MKTLNVKARRVNLVVGIITLALAIILGTIVGGEVGILLSFFVGMAGGVVLTHALAEYNSRYEWVRFT